MYIVQMQTPPKRRMRTKNHAISFLVFILSQIVFCCSNKKQIRQFISFNLIKQ